MVKKPLLDVMFASDKRKNVLKLLNNGPQSADVILDTLGTSRPALIPQMKILEDNHLIISQNGTYTLTTIGKLLVDNMTPLLSSIDVLDTNIDYWGTRELDFIPSSLLKRLSDLKSCAILEPSFSEIYEVNMKFHEKTKASNYMNRIATFLYPNFFSLYSEYIENGVEISLIFSKEVIDKIKSDYTEEFKELMQTGKIKIFLSQAEMPFLSIAYNEYSVFLRLLKRNLEFDSKQLICCSPSSIEWCKALFEFYLNRSISVTDI
ncbi:helix-turn-helix transcriptional regulator [Methanolobus halotolerans]|uniref:Transcriptional regulator n=1 Tax=Methanolobus halotolerans TaxID=2052935 RepID=A0A4E0PXJ5_9EURY|nr:winged helix-turn-helix domain-containing protein [Methanolobus halotolerans]TGC09433.1 transcriptional regulator [Methanolobus halotolerans]